VTEHGVPVQDSRGRPRLPSVGHDLEAGLVTIAVLVGSSLPVLRWAAGR
jgi:hypothetical protein